MNDESTTEQARWLQELHQFWNDYLFQGSLPKCLIGISDQEGLNSGHIKPRKRSKQATGEIVYEVWLKPEYFDASVYEVYLDLLHQLLRVFVHSKLDKPAKGYSYHDRQFADAALVRGIRCTGVGESSGSRTGYSVELAFIEGALAMNVLENMPEHLRVVPFKSRSEEVMERKGKRRTRVKVVCSECGWNVQSSKRDSQIQYCPVCAAEYLKQTKLKPTLVIEE